VNAEITLEMEALLIYETSKQSSATGVKFPKTTNTWGGKKQVQSMTVLLKM